MRSSTPIVRWCYCRLVVLAVRPRPPISRPELDYFDRQKRPKKSLWIWPYGHARCLGVSFRQLSSLARGFGVPCGPHTTPIRAPIQSGTPITEFHSSCSPKKMKKKKRLGLPILWSNRQDQASGQAIFLSSPIIGTAKSALIKQSLPVVCFAEPDSTQCIHTKYLVHTHASTKYLGT